MNYFTFDGIDSRTYNTYIATSNAFDAPGREDEIIKVPGSNNIYYLTEGTYKPFDIKLYCYIPSNMQVKTDDLRNFLLSKGTCTYTEAIRPNEFRVARFIEAYELDVSDRVSAAFVLTFKAQPQRYLTTNTPITTTATADTTTDTTMSLSTVPTPITISLNGNTTQEGSSGKNIFDYKYWADNITVIRGTKTVNGNSITITATDTDSYTNYRGTYEVLFPKVTTNTDYTLSWDRDSGSARGFVYVFNEGGSAITSAQSTAKKVTFNSGSNTFIQFRFGVQASGNSITYSNIMLEKGSTATSYEPHISPTNPQTIHNVSGDNTVNVTSKNIAKFEEPYFTAGVNYTHTDNSINISANGTYARVGYSFKVETGKQYSISFKAVKSSGSYGIIHVDNNNSWNNSYGGFTLTTTMAEYTKTLTANTDILFIGFYVTSNMTTGTMTVNDFMIEVNSTATPYEPYTAQSYPLYLPVENLNKIADVKSGWLPTSGAYPTTNGSYPNAQYLIVPLNKGETCYLSGTTNIKGRVRAMNTSAVIGTVTANTTYYTTTADQSGGFKEGSITALQDLLLGILFMDGYASSGGNELIIAKGTNIQNYSIELNKIGTYQDYIYKNGGKWYLHKAFNKITLDGSSDENVRKNVADTANYLYYWMGLPNIDATQLGYVYCNRLINTIVLDNINGGNGTVNLGCAMRSSSSQSVFYFNVGVYLSDNTLATVKTWLASNPLTFIYPLQTPTNTEITDTTLINQLNNIEKAYSYNGTTNILQVSNDNGFMLGVVSLHSNNVSSNYKGEPIITVNSTGLIYFNGCVIKVNQAPMTINSQTMQAYNGTVNLNNYIEANDFPMIEAGNNVIGSEMPLSIVPNYWKL